MKFEFGKVQETLFSLQFLGLVETLVAVVYVLNIANDFSLSYIVDLYTGEKYSCVVTQIIDRANFLAF